MPARYSPERDLLEARRMAEALADYVRGAALYGSAGGGFFGSGDLPPLTVGALLLRLRRLRALAHRLAPAAAADLATAAGLCQQVAREWTLHYEAKMHQEALSRLEAMRPFLREAADHPRSARANYPPELLRRTIVQELLAALAAVGPLPADLRDKVQVTDAGLRGLVTAAAFQWDSALEPVYPADVYWWLYHAPPVESPQD
ncbi:MAG: hypothetical protein MUE40_06960 [Anaerolineae bacterium]|jgi:hypothetical protein|nr:hypothetical protein [Anaerolineae bacterium]